MFSGNSQSSVGSKRKHSEIEHSQDELEEDPREIMAELDKVEVKPTKVWTD